MRRRKLTPHAPPKKLDKPVLIHPNEVYSLLAARTALGLGLHALQAEYKAGRLKYARRCKRVWFLGRWLLDWLEGGLENPNLAEGQEEEL